jgi:uncharacterized protein YjlB
MIIASKRAAPTTLRFTDDGLIPKDLGHDEALATIAQVPRPPTDSVYGDDGPRVTLWPA